MRHNYTNDDLLRAATAAKDAISDPYKNVPLTYLNHFLDALPDLQDDWQECSWDDILHTDERVKAEYFSGTVIEGIPDGISDNGIYIVDGNFIPFSTDARWYRIPAPVVAPDPAEHPVVIDGNGTAWFWSGTGDEYHSPERPSEYKDRFTNWTPGEVVPKVVETND